MLALALTVWLCRPGLPKNPCDADLTATRIDGAAVSIVRTAQPTTPRPVDCFYVYPTVSQESGDNAGLTVGSEERDAAIDQASRFSPLCNLWAPMYRQATAHALDDGHYGDRNVQLTAYESLLSAWNDYIAHDNDGRPIVFIGHSQGAMMLAYLLRQVVDDDAALRARMISALLIGGNIYQSNGADDAGWFSHIPACTSQTQTGCMIAYSTYDTTPPDDAIFGTPHKPGTTIVCTNPAALGGGAAPLDTFLRTNDTKARVPVATPWTEYPDLYVGRCMHENGMSWFQVTRTSSTRRSAPSIGAALPRWGLHIYDMALPLGNLVQDVAAQEAAYAQARSAQPSPEKKWLDRI